MYDLNRYSFMLLITAGVAWAASPDSTTDLQSQIPEAVWSPSRDWVPDETDGSIHCLGNGMLCVYSEGPNLIQVFGPTYSTTSIGHFRFDHSDLTCSSRRVMGTAVWEHEIRQDGKKVALITDFVDSELPCFIRQVQTSIPLEFVYSPEPDLRLASNTSMVQKAGAEDGFLIETPIGKPSVPFGNYPIPFAFFHQVTWKGQLAADPHSSTSTLRLTFSPGQSTLYITGGPDLSACLEHTQTVLSRDTDSMLRRTLTWWSDFTAQGRNFARDLPKDIPLRPQLVQILDDVAVLIKVQQAKEGGVLAGYPYHLGYVRDQYGVHRGLVALGHEEMSRDILNFYYRIFESSGQIRNAQAFGIPGLFHVHENDDVELTGYITLQAFDYLISSGDKDFIRQIFPMLEWAWTVQTHHLIQDMLPFNGDETYVAGGILPRSALNDGSAEATMLFIDSGQMLLDFALDEGLWEQARITREQQILTRVRDAYRKNFWHDNRLITNNPDRSRTPDLLPTVRHGVCESCVTVQWTLRTDQKRYVCLKCLPDNNLPQVEPKTFVLQSVSLTPIYFHSSLFEPREFLSQVEEIVHAYKQTGKLPSRPDSDVSVGYDYGLLLYALTELDHPASRDLYEKTIQLADSTGAWAEYYSNHKPKNTRCRPWESAINVEALLHWIEKEYHWH